MKKIVALLLVLLLVLSVVMLASCKKDKDGGDATPTPYNATEAKEGDKVSTVPDSSINEEQSAPADEASVKDLE